MTSDRNHSDVLVIGGGAAGLFCAITAGSRGKSVTVLEHAATVGSKIRISGGGRCNFTNLNVSAENYVSANPHFCRSALARFTPDDFLDLVRKHGIEWYEKQDGQLFCVKSSKEIIAMLLEECSRAGVSIVTDCTIDSVERNDAFTVTTGSGVFTCDALVVATGGLSLPELGASDFGLKLARQFGLRVIPPRPALVPFMLDKKWTRFAAGLSGISIDANVLCANTDFRGNILFTHKGLSGPAILQASLYWNEGESIELNLLPDHESELLVAEAQDSLLEVHTFLSRLFPKRFAQLWCELYGLTGPISRHSAKTLKSIFMQLQHWVVLPHKTEGYRTAEVMAGGVDTKDISSKTMEATKVPGLYFVGEVMDVTGWLGGYNFQWAWASGYAAGRAVRSKESTE